MSNAVRATNVTIDPKLLAEAKALNLDISEAAEGGLEAAIRKERERRWLKDNEAALRSSNEWVDKHGLPLELHRPF